MGSGSADNAVRVWNVKEKEVRLVVKLLGHDDKVRCIAFLQDRLISVSDDTQVIVWQWRTGTIMARIRDTGYGRVSVILTTRTLIISIYHYKMIQFSWDATRLFYSTPFLVILSPKCMRLTRTLYNHSSSIRSRSTS